VTAHTGTLKVNLSQVTAQEPEVTARYELSGAYLGKMAGVERHTWNPALVEVEPFVEEAGHQPHRARQSESPKVKAADDYRAREPQEPRRSATSILPGAQQTDQEVGAHGACLRPSLPLRGVVFRLIAHPKIDQIAVSDGTQYPFLKLR
jgi:hypothetical protein